MPRPPRLATPRPFPWSALVPWIEARGWHDDDVGWQAHPEMDQRGARKWVQKRKAQGLTWEEADLVATRMGTHPANVWPDFAEGGMWDVVDWEPFSREEIVAQYARLERVRERAA